MEKNIKDYPNCYLVGFMATGKSTVGPYLAKALGFGFIDSDRWIENKEGMSIAELIGQMGEAYFRTSELNFIEKGSPSFGQVIACGGGLIAQKGMPARLKSKGRVVRLEASMDTILKRIQTCGKKDRPLLQVADIPAQIKYLLQEREPYYACAEWTVSTDEKAPQLVASLIASWYRRSLGFLASE